MDELIKKVVEQLGLDEGVVRKSLGVILDFLKNNVGEDFDFQQVFNKLGGSESLVKEAERDSEAPADGSKKASLTSISGIIGLVKSVLTTFKVWDVLRKLLSTVFGENAVRTIESAGSGAEVVGKLNQLGVSKEQGKSMVQMLIPFMKAKLGDDLVDKMIDQVPIVKKYLDSSKKDE